MKPAARRGFLLGAAGFVILTLPQWISSVWSLFSSEPIIPVAQKFLKEKGVPDLHFQWIADVIGFGLLLWTAFGRRDNSSQGNRLNVSPVSTPNSQASGAANALDGISVQERKSKANIEFLGVRIDGVALLRDTAGFEEFDRVENFHRKVESLAGIIAGFRNESVIN
jgi:hypothetical protein